jgi:N-methylhydantoinase A/oxoprolinase/acetone carboxylase beta subunit
MTMEKSVYIIGCGVLGPDIHHIAKKNHLTLKKKFLPGGLHNQPNELRRRLQAAIDEVESDETCSRIVIGYGLCGKGTVNIHARKVPLVIPRVHDCIALFLGSDQAYRDQFAKEPGTYYISAGWYTEQIDDKKDNPDKIWVGSESMGSKEIREQYGDKSADNIINFFSSWHHNYNRAAFIDTGIGNKNKYKQHAIELANKHGWKFENIPGNLNLLTRLLTTEATTKEILVVPPNYTTIFSNINSSLEAVPKSKATNGTQPVRRSFIHEDHDKQELNIHYGLGIDAGGTYTDVVIHDFKTGKIVGKNKALTTKWDFTIGIDEAISELSSEFLNQLDLVAVSTTLATNAIVEGEGHKTGLIVMYGDDVSGRDLFTHQPCAFVSGSMSMDGIELAVVDEEEIRRVAREMMKNDGVNAFAVSGLAGAINPKHELMVKDILQEETGKIVCCGHELSDQLNLVVRAQTAVLNAQIIPRIMKFFLELETVLEKRQIHAPLMVVKGDGTLMSAEMAKEKPVETILSGPAASVAGAKYLTGLNEAMVVDMGGTTTDTADILDGQVNICESGANVGGYVTHVRALDMRTEGLGGDSLIVRHKGQFSIGPRRVAPLVWAGANVSGGIDAALSSMQARVDSDFRVEMTQQILVAMDGKVPFELTDQEAAILNILKQRAHTLDELVKKLSVLRAQFLFIDRLESCGLVQRCGLTPTDLLHLAGHFNKWDSAPASKMIEIVSKLSHMPSNELVPFLIREVEKKLAIELFRKQLSKDIDTDSIDECPVCQHFMKRMLSDKTDSYAIQAKVNLPIIGIGAPINYFLPKAGEYLNAEIIIPEDADVANALGAITSKIFIRKKVLIRPDQNGYFLVEGVVGRKIFDQIAMAEEWAIEHLKKQIWELGRLAGTSRKRVELSIEDSIVNLSEGDSLFLGRTIEACLTGNPDILLRMVS